jgi:DNA helicase-2/ATP-dependent DNA helicase PcrA
VVDFAELMLRTYELMRDNRPLREHYQRRFRHILVDEFQDTNTLQYAWLKMFAGPPEHGCALFCVGDDDQSIYAFRGAQVGNMAAFEREYRVRIVVKLERNYRSYGNILDAANELIAKNSRRLGKNLRTEAGPGEPVRVHEAPSDFAEAQWFVEEAQQLHRDGTPRHEIALLYRSNAQSRVMESALFNAHIPYKVYGGLRFFERAEVKHALSYLRLIENPNDDTSFLRVVNFPARGIGSRTIEQLQDAAKASGGASGRASARSRARAAQPRRVRRQDRRDARRDARPDPARDHRPHARGVGPGRLLQDRPRRQGAAREPRGAGQRRRGFVTQEGFGKDAVALPVDEAGAGGLGIYRGEAGKAEFNTPGAEVVTSGEIVAPPRLVPDADTGEIMSPLAAFLTHAALEAGDNQAQAGEDAVQLMTIHSAKGLEFDCVFISGLEEGLFPHENSASDLDGLEEERRLMYVAITRARSACT